MRASSLHAELHRVLAPRVGLFRNAPLELTKLLARDLEAHEHLVSLSPRHEVVAVGQTANDLVLEALDSILGFPFGVLSELKILLVQDGKETGFAKCRAGVHDNRCDNYPRATLL